eukprot:Hpha_TRINITY_DN2944_c0_g1::TRINITY_DN2944_c0_g1_i1::g.19558::m.19558
MMPPYGNTQQSPRSLRDDFTDASLQEPPRGRGLACLLPVISPVLKGITRAGEGIEEQKRKEVLVGASGLLVLLLVASSVSDFESLTGTWLALSVAGGMYGFVLLWLLTFWIVLRCTRRLSRLGSESWIVPVIIAIFFIDIVRGCQGDGGDWWLLTLVPDFLVVSGARPTALGLICGLCSAFAVFRSYLSARRGNDFCTSMHLASGSLASDEIMSSWAVSSSYLVSWFAVGGTHLWVLLLLRWRAEEDRNRGKTAVKLVDMVCKALGRFDLSTAERHLSSIRAVCAHDDVCAKTRSPCIRQSLRQILSCLRRFRPYLPDALLEGEVVQTDETEASDGTPVLQCRCVAVLCVRRSTAGRFDVTGSAMSGGSLVGRSPISPGLGMPRPASLNQTAPQLGGLLPLTISTGSHAHSGSGSGNAVPPSGAGPVTSIHSGSGPGSGVAGAVQASGIAQHPSTTPPGPPAGYVHGFAPTPTKRRAYTRDTRDDGDVSPIGFVHHPYGSMHSVLEDRWATAGATDKELPRWLTRVADTIRSNRGTVHSFNAGEVVATFGAVAATTAAAAQACGCALTLTRTKLRDGATNHCGVAFGEALVGTLQAGSADDARRTFQVMGPVVDTARELAGLAEETEAAALCCPRSRAQASGAVTFQLVDDGLFEIVAEHTEATTLRQQLGELGKLPEDRFIPMKELDTQEWMEIGRGSCGKVYRAHYTALQDAVAIKELAQGRIGGLPQLRKRVAFVREIMALNKLRVNQIVNFYGWTEGQRGEVYMITEYCAGGGLRDIISEFTLRPAQRGRIALEMGLSVAQALSYIHGRGLVHLDVAARNILLNTAGQYKLSDVGLITREGSPATTISYPWSPPEAVRTPSSERKASWTHDSWAFGMLLYEVLEGQGPYWHLAVEHPSPKAWIDAVVDAVSKMEHPVDPRAVTSQPRCASARLLWSGLVKNCWAAEPTRRPTMASIVRTIVHIKSDPTVLPELAAAELPARRDSATERSHLIPFPGVRMDDEHEQEEEKHREEEVDAGQKLGFLRALSEGGFYEGSQADQTSFHLSSPMQFTGRRSPGAFQASQENQGRPATERQRSGIGADAVVINHKDAHETIPDGLGTPLHAAGLNSLGTVQLPVALQLPRSAGRLSPPESRDHTGTDSVIRSGINTSRDRSMVSKRARPLPGLRPVPSQDGDHSTVSPATFASPQVPEQTRIRASSHSGTQQQGWRWTASGSPELLSLKQSSTRHMEVSMEAQTERHLITPKVSSTRTPLCVVPLGNSSMLVNPYSRENPSAPRHGDGATADDLISPNHRIPGVTSLLDLRALARSARTLNVPTADGETVDSVTDGSMSRSGSHPNLVGISGARRVSYDLPPSTHS